MTPGLVAALAAAGAVALAMRPRPPLDRPAVAVSGRRLPPLLTRSLMVAGASLVVVAVVPGPWGIAVAGGATLLVLRLAGAEPAELRRARQQRRRQLPTLVGLLATALESGQPPERALELACEALPGPAAQALEAPRARLSMGMSATDAWAPLAADADLEPLVRVLVRAEASGFPVADAIGRLSDDLAAQARARITDAARTVGVRVAVPLGVCLLPAFLLVGIVPLVAAALSGLHW
ncbi:type II secretion system F family protein [Nocardioides limicola]|uniref:type II secretion system F family protein n=1 Tax=Nocardioides limicola TaxID=2803368 RepID=UPI00193C7B85|nr:type II secretion system F family protein [Nocardioides sp. DJM-14]